MKASFARRGLDVEEEVENIEDCKKSIECLSVGLLGVLSLPWCQLGAYRHALADEWYI